MKRLLRYLLSIATAIVIVIGMRLFLIGSYRISTDAMADALQRGDFVLVNKMKDKNNPGRNRIVLFKSPMKKDRKSPPLFISRCMGMPGDTMQISREGYWINGKFIPNSPATKNVYRIQKDIKQTLLTTLRRLQIPSHDMEEDSLSLIISLTSKEEMILRENLPNLIQFRMIERESCNYTFIIPSKGHSYPIDSTSLILYKDAILTEMKENTIIHNDKLIQNGKETDRFFFQQNYYWMLSDNGDDAIDSRHLGLIPESSMIGNVWFCWYSKDKERLFKRLD
ncbi:MAG: signal peptidase I [Tannerella sp.]|jgi:signal peptidase I|nr:signal peptidase I [Tannerella sp.]